MKTIKTTDIIKNLVRIFCITVLCGIVIFALMLLLVKHNEICELIFSGAGFAVGALVLGLVVGFLVGYFKCFFEATKIIDGLASSREELNTKYLHCKAKLKYAEESLDAYKAHFKNQTQQNINNNRNSIIGAIEDFPIDEAPAAPQEESSTDNS